MVQCWQAAAKILHCSVPQKLVIMIMAVLETICRYTIWNPVVWFHLPCIFAILHAKYKSPNNFIVCDPFKKPHLRGINISYVESTCLNRMYNYINEDLPGPEKNSEENIIVRK